MSELCDAERCNLDAVCFFHSFEGFVGTQGERRRVNRRVGFCAGHSLDGFIIQLKSWKIVQALPLGERVFCAHCQDFLRLAGTGGFWRLPWLGEEEVSLCSRCLRCALREEVVA